jgi:hypothetical protein
MSLFISLAKDLQPAAAILRSREDRTYVRVLSPGCRTNHNINRGKYNLRKYDKIKICGNEINKPELNITVS